MEEEIIEAVRNEKCLYDRKHPDYMKVEVKDAIWYRIAKELNFKTGNEAKRAWEKLRNNYRDALRRQNRSKKSGSTLAIKRCRWRFQQQMDFLFPHMTNRLIDENQPPGRRLRYIESQEESDNSVESSNDGSSESDPIPTNDVIVSDAKNDPLFHFFLSMYETTKRLPPLSQHVIKTDVFSVVSKQECEHIIEQQKNDN